MAETTPRAAESLFNNPLLSDVKIKQVYKGKTREYYAHKAILCTQSKYFLKMFTGNFKEASANEIELHEDIPEHFEILLQFMYTGNHDIAAITKLAGDDLMKRHIIPIGLYTVADKYEIERVGPAIAEDIKNQRRDMTDDGFKTLIASIKALYDVDVNGTEIKEIFVGAALGQGSTFWKLPEVERLMVTHPMFAADLALALCRRNDIGEFHKNKCSRCSRIVKVLKSEVQHSNYLNCYHCGASYTKI